MKIDFIGNIYIQSTLNQLELSYLQTFSKSVHYDNNSSEFLGLYDISILKENLNQKDFVFNQELDLTRSLESNFDKETFKSDLFPFFKSPFSFSEKSIQFNIPAIKNSEEFMFFINHLSESLLFYYYHFFSKNCFSKQLNSDFFNFFSEHSISGKLYFKLNEYGHIYRLTCNNEIICLSKGSYPTVIRGKKYLINNVSSFDIELKKQLISFYNNLSIIDIKKNALFEEEGTNFYFNNSKTLDKLIQFNLLNNKLQSRGKNKINKI